MHSPPPSPPHTPLGQPLASRPGPPRRSSEEGKGLASTPPPPNPQHPCHHIQTNEPPTNNAPGNVTVPAVTGSASHSRTATSCISRMGALTSEMVGSGAGRGGSCRGVVVLWS
jgi:hypothetical protein